MDPPADAGRPPARLDETGRYRLSPDIPAEGLVRRYRQQLALIVAPLLLLLLVLAAWQLWQARGAAVADLERQAAQQAASLQSLARTVSEHVADLRWQAERTLAPGAAGAPDAALLQALQQRPASGAGFDGYVLDALPPLLHAGSAQWVWSRPEAPGPDALAASQVLGRVAEVAHARHPELAGSRWVAWPERWVAAYPFEPSSALLERWRASTAAELLARLMADEAFAAGRPQANPQRATYWTAIRTSSTGESPQIEHAVPVYDGDEFRGVVSARIRLEAIARAAATALKGQTAAPWWVLSARGELLAAHEDRGSGPPLQGADLASMRQAGGRAVGYGGSRAVVIDTPDAPWTLVVARTDAALLAQALPGLLPFALMALGLFGLFLQAQSLLRRRLIEPALGVMGYLHDKSVDPATPEPDLPARWRPWARVVTRTIDDQRAARAAERRSEALKSAIVDHALAALVATDAQGRIVEFNPAAEVMFGHRRASVLGKPASEVIVPPRRDRAAHDAGLRRAAAGGPTKSARPALSRDECSCAAMAASCRSRWCCGVPMWRGSAVHGVAGRPVGERAGRPWSSRASATRCARARSSLRWAACWPAWRTS
jgi:PAS domain-containing protein